MAIPRPSHSGADSTTRRKPGGTTGAFVYSFVGDDYPSDPTTWQFEGVVGQTLGESRVRHADYRRFVRESYLRNVRMFSGRDLPHTIELLSDDFFAAWDARELRTDVFDRPSTLGGPIGFCYIDGDHSYVQAKRDFENADRHLLPGGLILFDDSSDGTKFEVGRLIDEVKRREDYRVVVKNPNYLVQKIA